MRRIVCMIGRAHAGVADWFACRASDRFSGHGPPRRTDCEAVPVAKSLRPHDRAWLVSSPRTREPHIAEGFLPSRTVAWSARLYACGREHPAD